MERPDAYARPEAVRTELPATKSVQSSWPGQPVEKQVSQHASALGRLAADPHPTEQRFERDKDTSTLVFKQIDPESGEIIMQLPSKHLLDLRAYLKQQGGDSAAIWRSA